MNAKYLLEALAGYQVGGRFVHLHHTISNEQRPIEARQLTQIVKSDHDERPVIGNSAEYLRQAKNPERIEVGECLVEEERFWTSGKSPGQQHARPFTGRQSIGRPAGEGAKFEKVDQFRDPHFVTLSETESDHVAHGNRPCQVARSRKECQQFAPPRFAFVEQGLAIDLHGAACFLDA